MSTAAADVVGADARSRGHRPAPGATVRFELVKLLAPWRTRVLLAACLVGPAAFVAVVSGQGTLPSDTVFGRWMHATGWAGVLVVLAFCCSWVLPLATAMVAGDVFAAEDRQGTWRHLLMAVRDPRRIFGAKVVAAALVVELLVLALGVSAVIGGMLAAGNRALVGLDGQQVGPGHAAVLTLAAWVYVAVATLAWAAVGFLASSVLGRSPVALLLPAMIAAGLQLLTMLPLPLGLRMALPSEAFVAWRGLFSQVPQARTLMLALATNLVWTLVTTVLARWVFVRRDFSTLAYDGSGRRAFVVGVLPLVVLVGLLALAISASLGSQRDGGGIHQDAVERSVSTSFAHLYVLQTQELNRPAVTEAQLNASAQCDKGGDLEDDLGAGNDWRCVVTWHLPGATAVGQAIYQLDISPDGRIVADGDGPTDVNGYYVVRTATGTAPNPLWQVDGLVDLTTPHP